MLELLGQEENLTLTQLADRLQAGKTTVFRLATSLVDRGWVTKDEELRYSLGPAAIRLSADRGNLPDLNTLLMPLLIELHEETQETIHLTRLEGRSVVYISQLLSPKPVLSLTTLGSRSPAHCVSPGLALLAALPDSRIDWVLRSPLVQYTDKSITSQDKVREEIRKVRQRGYGINLGTFRKEVGGVGVAVLDDKGEPIAGLSVCMPVFRLAEIDIDALGKRLIRAAQDAEIVVHAALQTSQDRAGTLMHSAV